MATAAVEHEQVRRPACWCCGNTFDDADLTRLGTHPEVGVLRRVRAVAAPARTFWI